jgi:hypothetical protein
MTPGSVFRKTGRNLRSKPILAFLTRLLLVYLFVLNFSMPSHAVEVEPMRLQLVIPYDEPTQGELRISNPESRSVKIHIHSGPYRFLQAETTMPSAQEWIRFDPDTLILAPGAIATVSYTIHPPANIAHDTAGEYVAAILVDRLPWEESSEGNPVTSGTAHGTIAIVPRLAIPVYLQIQQRRLEAVELKGPNISLKDRFIQIETIVHNRGTVHVRPNGTVMVFRSDTGQLHRQSSLGKALPIFPGSQAALPVWMPVPEAGSYRAVVTIEAGGLLQREVRFRVTESGEVTQTESQPVLSSG